MSIRQWIADARRERAYAKAERAIKLHASYAGEAEVQRRLADWYNREIAKIVPREDYHRFAELCQKEDDAVREHAACQQKADEALAVAEARASQR